VTAKAAEMERTLEKMEQMVMHKDAAIAHMREMHTALQERHEALEKDAQRKKEDLERREYREGELTKAWQEALKGQRMLEEEKVVRQTSEALELQDARDRLVALEERANSIEVQLAQALERQRVAEESLAQKQLELACASELHRALEDTVQQQQQQQQQLVAEGRTRSKQQQASEIENERAVAELTREREEVVIENRTLHKEVTGLVAAVKERESEVLRLEQDVAALKAGHELERRKQREMQQREKDLVEAEHERDLRLQRTAFESERVSERQVCRMQVCPMPQLVRACCQLCLVRA